MLEDGTKTDELIFQVVMSQKDHDSIITKMTEQVDRISAIINKTNLSAIVLFFTMCVIMSVIILFLTLDIQKSNALIFQSDAQIKTLKQTEIDLKSIISAQKSNRSKLNNLYEKVPSLVNKKPTIITKTLSKIVIQKVKVPMPVSNSIVTKVFVPIKEDDKGTPVNRDSSKFNSAPIPYWIYDKFNKRYYSRYNHPVEKK